jgi:hypothetical protein
LLLIALAVACARPSADFLVLDTSRPSDWILVDYGRNGGDEVYWEAMRLLRGGKAMALLVPGPDAANVEELEDAVRFVRATAGSGRAQVEICPTATGQFYAGVARCLERSGARSVMIVTPAQNSRLALLQYSRRLPQYSWSVASLDDPYWFQPQWWRHRRWASTYVRAWQSLLAEMLHSVI